MSEQQEEGIVIRQDGGEAAFAALMGALAPEPADQADEAAGEADPADAGGDGQPAPVDEGARGEAASGGEPGQGAPGDPDVQGEPAGADGSESAKDGSRTDETPGVGAVDYASLKEDFTKISVALEEGTTKRHQEAALASVKKEFGEYVDAINQHPRRLVGMKVPAIGREGHETMRDEEDVVSWQGAVKQLLADEVNARAQRAISDDSNTLSTLHSAIELFQNNSDLVPGTKQFDKGLADEVMALAKPYEKRVDGKLQGFLIDVQPLINQVRQSRVGRKPAPAPQAPASKPVTPAKDSAPAPKAKGPQAGIKSKAGESGQGENFDALWGTLGLPGGIRL